MSALPKPLPTPPLGFRYYKSEKQILHARELFAYQHLLRKAWTELKLTGVLTLNGVPTVYVADCRKPLPAQEAAERHLKFWNQGLATVLLLRDPQRVRVLSSMTKPQAPPSANDDTIADSVVEDLTASVDLATQAAWAERFYLQIGNGHYYSRPENRSKFDPKQTVDAYLLDNLESVRDELMDGRDGLSAPIAHAFLGRMLFTCYLCHRGIVKLENYIKGTDGMDLLQLLVSTGSAKAQAVLYDKLFPALRKEFNSSMFDEDLSGEQSAIKPRHLLAIQHFLEGSEVRSGQRTLGFNAYDFSFIPVETISSIYEKFLEHEDEEGKRKLGAYYTPRLLAEMTLDLALRDRQKLSGLRFFDPSCGSGIFLVLAFNRLVSEWRASLTTNVRVATQAKALLGRLGQLTGVDKNLTACRITCFSLYLAFLDQFTPTDVRHYIDKIGKLPNLLTATGFKKTDVSVVHHRDFLELPEAWHGKFDIVMGNPPWVGRGTKQLAHRFMSESPRYLNQHGVSCLILPTKVFLNKTDDFQKTWLSQATLETVIQMADFRFILFKEALCPAAIVRFTPHQPANDHEIEYITPKVTRSDLRDGLIAVSPQDRKWLPLKLLLSAAQHDVMSVVWKTRLWGTARDQKLLGYLFTFPRLGSITEQLRGRQPKMADKLFVTGQGCKPWKASSKTKPDRELKELGDWKPEDPIV
ncbi:MAG: N-6 DNA methylase, partial [Verrucomicrobiales bacterium]|nr:N-6 DNA methylase [Verrucomicrobiales bacterium]